MDPLIEEIIEPGERILWTGCPDKKKLFHIYDIVIIPFGVFFTGFAVFWTVFTVRLGTFFQAVGAIFIIVSLYITIGRLFFERFIRQRTIYAITNKRAIIVVDILRKNIRSVNFEKSLTVLKQTDKLGSGNIKFGRDAFVTNPHQGWNYNTATGFSQPNMYGYDSIIKAPGFYDLAEAGEVYDIIMRVIEKTPK